MRNLRPHARSWLVLGVAAALAAAVGCQSTQTTRTATPADPPSRTAVDPDPVETKSDHADADLQPIYFDYDSWQLGAQARKALKGNAERIRSHPEWGVLRVEGHCDERGSDEYNLALGERRAAVVAAYLVDLGVPASRLEKVSFGEARPAVPGHAESAWRYNRRSEIRSPSLQLSGR